MSAALQQGAGGNPAYLSFYLAVAKYLEAALSRLHVESARAGEMVRSKLGTPDAAVSDAFLAYDQCLTVNGRYLVDLSRFRERLEQDGTAALASFEQFIREYTAFIIGNMGHHELIVDLAKKLLSVDDLAYMVAISDEEKSCEQSLYERVFASVPPGLQLPGNI